MPILIISELITPSVATIQSESNKSKQITNIPYFTGHRIRPISISLAILSIGDLSRNEEKRYERQKEREFSSLPFTVAALLFIHLARARAPSAGNNHTRAEMKARRYINTRKPEKEYFARTREKGKKAYRGTGKSTNRIARAYFLSFFR